MHFVHVLISKCSKAVLYSKWISNPLPSLLFAKHLTLKSFKFSSWFSVPSLFTWLIQAQLFLYLFILPNLYLSPVVKYIIKIKIKTFMHPRWHKHSPLCLLYEPRYKRVKYQDAGGLRASEASFPFSHCACRRDFDLTIQVLVFFCFFFCCVAWACEPSQTSLLRPSASLRTDSSLPYLRRPCVIIPRCHKPVRWVSVTPCMQS